ncbi:methyltransferase domain-containing protein [Leptospira idonii]|uniref:Methyltransferase domain-containing protein n=2 Tax=Leptospira idonii TaxID=1193500 RepID=A0A4R9LW02_9LEPT|nr:methyltransferase domain-containing protein [Leptospira idonii]
MTDSNQADAYANADFSEAHSSIIRTLVDLTGSRFVPKRILDLGAGSGDMTYRLHTAFPSADIYAVDGSEEMLSRNQKLFQEKGKAAGEIHWELTTLQTWIPEQPFDLIFSNSLLHHLADPFDFWGAVQRATYEESFIFVSDLFRPESFQEAEFLVNQYSGNEPDVLKKDFYNSLLAAYRIEEVESMLIRLKLDQKLKIDKISDRHWICYSRNVL